MRSLLCSRFWLGAGPQRATPGRGLVVSCLAAALLCLATSSFAEAQEPPTVLTLGGGPLSLSGAPYGDLDGKTLERAQFHSPWGCALDSQGSLYVADRDNGKIRKLDVAGNLTRTWITGLPQPVDVAVDPKNSLYVACLGTNVLLKFDRYLTYAIGGNLERPSAVALKIGTGNQVTDIYVAELGHGAGGAIKRIDPLTQTVSWIAGGLGEPQGLAVLDNGWLAVSESSAHAIRLIDPQTGTTMQQIGGLPLGAGFRDGPLKIAQFNQPHHLAKAPDGSLLVADRGNDCVRLVTTDGYVVTLYGIDPLDWGFDNPTAFLGWWDGSVEVAESREPVGVTVGPDGTVYTTEVYYHIVREVIGAGLTPATGGGGSATNSTVVPPIITVPGLSVLAGYYPMGLTLYVTNQNESSLLPIRVFYTTDGTEPTTNSLEVTMVDNVGAIQWRESARDLSALRVKAFVGTVGSSVVAGQTVAQNEIGISRDVNAGIGATTIIPVVLNLKLDQTFRSLQYRVQVAPVNLRPGIDPVTLQVLTYTNKDMFLPMAGTAEADKPTLFHLAYYSSNQTEGAAVAFIGTNAQFRAQNFAVTSLISVRVPPTAREGDQYTVEVLDASGTSDGTATSVSLAQLPPRTLLVTNYAYLVGESSPANGYGAGEFGAGWLKNSDVNNAYYASLGVNLPFPFTDVFNAMDAYPPDSLELNQTGGDGQIRFLDWQTILMRSLHLWGETQNYRRAWGSGGVRRLVANPSGLVAKANRPAQVLTASAGRQAWYREALLGAGTVENVSGSNPVDVPVYLLIQPGCQISGFQFRVLVIPQSNAPGLTTTMEFSGAENSPNPAHFVSLAVNDLSCAWDVGAFQPALTGSNFLGRLRFRLPYGAEKGQSYLVRVANADGAPNLSTQYNFETLPGRVWIGAPAAEAPQLIPDEWKTYFYGSSTNALAADNADPNEDGISNLQAYRAGINPLPLQLIVLQTEWRANPATAGFKLRWFGVSGKRYSVESTANPALGPWTVVGSDLIGAQEALEFVAPPAGTGPIQFYRVRQEP